MQRRMSAHPPRPQRQTLLRYWISSPAKIQEASLIMQATQYRGDVALMAVFQNRNALLSNNSMSVSQR